MEAIYFLSRRCFSNLCPWPGRDRKQKSEGIVRWGAGKVWSKTSLPPSIVSIKAGSWQDFNGSASGHFAISVCCYDDCYARGNSARGFSCGQTEHLAGHFISFCQHPRNLCPVFFHGHYHCVYIRICF